MAFELIKISEFPQVNEPSEWIAVADANGVAYKISKADFKEWLGTVQTIVPKAISPTDPAPTLDGVYKPTVDGTYANAGGIVVDRSEGGEDYGMSVEIIKNGSVYVKYPEPLPIQDISGLAEKSELQYKGTFDTPALAIAGIPLLDRKLGDTVGINEDGSIIEYWFKDSVSDTGLVQKTFSDIVQDNELVYIIVDEQNRILFSIDSTGKVHANLDSTTSVDGNNLNLQLLKIAEQGTQIEGMQPYLLKELSNDEYIYAVVDSDNKILLGVRYDGTGFIGSENSNVSNKGIVKYDNVVDACIAGQKDIFLVGEMMFTPTRETIGLKGVFSNFKATDIVDQFDLVGNHKLSPQPNPVGELIRIATPLDKGVISGFSDGYVYFTDRLFLYRTKDEINEPCNKDTAQFEKFILPYPLPEQTINGLVYSCLETRDGGLLVEIGNGPNIGSGILKNLYKIHDVASIEGVLVNGVLEKTVTNITHVCTLENGSAIYPPSLIAWNFKTYNNIVLIAPYSLGRTSQLYLSTDFGNTFARIFSGLDSLYVATRPNGSGGFGSIGYHPMPSDVNPPQPSTMWDIPSGGNGNVHSHGVAYDPYWDRIWLVTGDCPTPNGYTAIWYTDDLGKKWNRVELRAPMYPHTELGTQFVSIIVMPNYVLFGCDGSGDGYYRYNRKSKDEIPTVELAYQYTGINSSLLVVAVGDCVSKDGMIYGAFSPDNDDFATQVGGVVASSDGYNFTKIYEDQFTEGTAATAEINWVSRVADRNTHIMVEAKNGGIIKINK